MSFAPPAKTIYLHIGTQKTGTTTLQALGMRNRAALAARGVLYPTAPGKQNHVGLTLFAFGGVGNRDISRGEELNSPDAMQAYIANLPGALLQEVRASGCETVWLSNEHLSSRVRRPEQIAKVAALLKPMAEQVKVVTYLRHQPEYYLSSYSMEIKAGGDREIPPPTTGQEYYYNYERLLGAWAESFGDAAMVVRVFEREALKNSDVVDDFFEVMGLVPGPDIDIPPALNTSLDADMLRFLLLFRQHIPRFTNDMPNPEHGDILRALEEVSTGARFSLPGETMRQIAEAFAPSNARVAKRFLGRDDGVLFKPVDYSAEIASPPLTVERAVQIAAQVWRFKQHQIADMKARRKRPDGVSSPG